MGTHQQAIEIRTGGRGSYDLGGGIQAIVDESGIDTGICQVFCRHTSASLLLTENADPDVRADLESFMARLVPDGDPIYRHTLEGPDDMSAHVRSMLTQSSLSLPVGDGRCLFGTWQGVYLWEHRAAGHRRTVTVTVLGEHG
ncbi:MAG: secondary thiamine-phosphate synthase enzyme YjbQ [Gammaproteobacteria bacterium]